MTRIIPILAALLAVAAPAQARVDNDCTGRLVAEAYEAEPRPGPGGLRQMEYAVVLRNTGARPVSATVTFARALRGAAQPVRATLAGGDRRRVLLGVETWRGPGLPDQSALRNDIRVSCAPSQSPGRMVF